jgi:hypothetical protein
VHLVQVILTSQRETLNIWQDLFLKLTLTLKKNIKSWVYFSQKVNYFSWTVFYGEFDFLIKKTKRAKANDIYFQKWAF